MREKRFHSSCHVPKSHARSEKKKISTYLYLISKYPSSLLPSMVRHNHDANDAPANTILNAVADLANVCAEEKDCVNRYGKLARRKMELFALRGSYTAAKREESDNARINADLANAFAEEKDCCKRLIELQDRKNELQNELLFKEANVPLEQQEPSPDSDDFDVEEEVGSTDRNSQTNDDNTTKTTRKFNALEKRLDLLEEDVMDLQMNNDKILALAAAVPFVLTFAMYCLRHFASSMSRD